jgi:hypothetical protein
MLDRRAFLTAAGATLVAGPTGSFARRLLTMAAVCNQMARGSYLSTPYSVIGLGLRKILLPPAINRAA